MANLPRFHWPAARSDAQIEGEMLEELDTHIALCVEYLVAQGVPRDVAGGFSR